MTETLKLAVPFFKLTDIDDLKLLKMLEVEAVRKFAEWYAKINQKGPALVGADGKPVPSVVAEVSKQINERFMGLLTRPTLEQVFAPTGPVFDPGAADGATYEVGLMFYKEFGRILSGKTPDLVPIIDGIVLVYMDSLNKETDPLPIFREQFTFKVLDANKHEVLLTPEQRELNDKMLQVALNYLNAYFKNKGLLEDGEPTILVDGQPKLHRLNLMGKRLNMHLLSLMGATNSLRAQAPDILEAFEAANKGKQSIEVPDGQPVPKLQDAVAAPTDNPPTFTPSN